MSLTNKSIIISPSCTWKELAGQVIILQANISPPLTHELNGSGSFVWCQLKDGPKRFEELLESFMESFEGSEEVMSKDLTELIEKLEGLKLIRSVE